MERFFSRKTPSESGEKSFSVASLVQSVKDRCYKAVDCVKDRVPSFDRKTLVLLGALATPTAMANTPPSWAPLAPIASSVITSPSWAPADELDKTLADIFPSYTMLESPLVLPLASENQAWSLFPVQEIRDIGADDVSDSAIVRADTKKEEPKKKPQSDTRNVAGKDENEWLSPREMTEEEWQLALLEALRGVYPDKTLQEIKDFLHATRGTGIKTDVHLRASSQPQNGSPGKEVLQRITSKTIDGKEVEGISEVTLGNVDQAFMDVMTTPFSGTPTFRVHEESAKQIIAQYNKMNDDFPRLQFKSRMVQYLNNILSVTSNVTPENLRHIFNGAPQFIAYESGDPGLKEDIAKGLLDAVESARSSISNDPALIVSVLVHWKEQTFTALSIDEAEKIAGKSSPYINALGNEALAFNLAAIQKEAMTSKSAPSENKVIAHVPTSESRPAISRASLDADIALMVKQHNTKDAS